MKILLDCSVFLRPDGDLIIDVRTTQQAQALGALPVRASWSIHPDRDPGSDEDHLAGLALATEALGSRLLRVANSIGQQRSLFDLDVPHGGAA